MVLCCFTYCWFVFTVRALTPSDFREVRRVDVCTEGLLW